MGVLAERVDQAVGVGHALATLPPGVSWRCGYTWILTIERERLVALTGAGGSGKTRPAALRS